MRPALGAALVGLALGAPLDAAAQRTPARPPAAPGRVVVGFHALDPDRGPLDLAGLAVLQDAFLDRVGRPRRGRGTVRFRTVPYLALDVDRQGFATVTDPAVSAGMEEEFGVSVRVGRDLLLRALSPPASPTGPAAAATPLGDLLGVVEADEVHAIGYMGEGQVIVVVDTGVEPDYWFLDGAVAFGADLSSGDAACGDATREGNAPEQGEPNGGSSKRAHGTEVASVAAGGVDPTYGVAPAARVVSLQVGGADGTVWSSAAAAALEEVACKWSLVDGLNVAAVNVSLGSEAEFEDHCDDVASEAVSLVRDVVADLWDLGIPVVAGAGNSWPFDVVTFPACLRSTLSVTGTSADGLEKSTNAKWSPLVDVAAPGVRISIVDSATGTESWFRDGTSIAAPFASGAIALLRQAYPDCPPGVILRVLVDEGEPAVYPVTSLTIPSLRISRAFAKLRSACGEPVPPP